MARSKKKVVFGAIGILIGLFFILPAIGFSILRWGVLPPERLTPLVVEKTNEFIDAHLECEKVELTYFETYPHLGIKLTNGRLISHLAEDSTAHEEELHIPSDSLLSFREAVISLRPTDFLFGGKITIGNITIDSPRFHGFVNKEGKSNWAIYNTEPDSTAAQANTKPIPPIDLQKVRITNGHFTYDDRQQHLFAEIKDFALALDGSLTEGENLLDVETSISSLLFRSPAYTLNNHLSLGLKSRLLLSNNYNTITLQGAEMRVNAIPFTANGSVESLPETKRLRIDMDMGLKASDMNELLRFVPDAYFQNREQTVVKGSVVLEGRVWGELGDSITPSVNLCCKIGDGSFHMAGIKDGLDTIRMDLDVHLNGLFPDSSYVSLEELHIKGLNTAFNMQGQVKHLFRNPTVEAELKGKIDFTNLAKKFLNPDTLLLEGELNADLKTSFAMNDLLNARYGKIHSSGNLDIPQLKAYSQPLGIDAYLGETHLFIGSVEKESNYLNEKNLLNATLKIDTLSLKYKEEISTRISRFQMQANTPPIVDTSAIVPITASIRIEHLSSMLADSAWVIAHHTVIRGGMKASTTNKKIPTAGAIIDVDTLKYFVAPIRTGVILAGSQITLEALPYREAARALRAQRTAGTDSLRARTTRRDSARLVQVADSTDFTNDLLRQWEVRGDIGFKQLNGFSRLFPLRMRMEQTKVKFTTNAVSFTDAKLHLGKSNLTLNGELNQIRRALLRGGKLKGTFALTSDYIDCNQLMTALGSGMIYSENQERKAEQAANEGVIVGLNQQDLNDAVADAAATTDSTNQVFVLPEFLDITLHTNAKRIDFKDLELANVQGDVILRNQSANLSNLTMQSNIGYADLTMAYTAKSRKSATVGFDLNMQDILVERLIDLYPAIDTLVPMLRSFQGVVDCQITATCRIDSSLSVVLPSLHSTCYLNGKNMVLLDGEAFAEISKTLMFKNKGRNVIDSISVDLAIHDNKIDIFPFLVELDRYKVAVGGTHKLDMTFDYHISVLKSPVPFKLGIDISGNLDKFKYKIVKCRYKDFLKPAKQAELENSRINIRQEIRENIRKQLKEAAPELAGSLMDKPISSRPVYEDEPVESE